MCNARPICDQCAGVSEEHNHVGLCSACSHYHCSVHDQCRSWPLSGERESLLLELEIMRRFNANPLLEAVHL
jgi:hypothetical protein